MFLRPQKKTDVPNLCNHCRASGSIIFEWRNCISISVPKYLGIQVWSSGENDNDDCCVLYYEILYISEHL